ncbi:hypothetical protein [Streptomyces sp. NBC_01803]|uniref:hypothetical protein n=1 Tax=Streptomyces sp. NBC_01803 TaxID=2975946 RepID=UPI002DDC193D|nr:hypothetical protein [Streptomyces sp. NBC_01803]WSA46370.1 hypothetical protein OIE51_20585 [Streptomyces sp. NBC_01803]
MRSLLCLPDEDDDEARREIADLLETVARDRKPLPDRKEPQRRLAAGQPFTSRMTVGEWLDSWIASRKSIRRTTQHGYASHSRLHLKPRIGRVRLDRLNLTHLIRMFDAIADENEVIAAENQARREQVARHLGQAEQARRLRRVPGWPRRVNAQLRMGSSARTVVGRVGLEPTADGL